MTKNNQKITDETIIKRHKLFCQFYWDMYNKKEVNWSSDDAKEVLKTRIKDWDWSYTFYEPTYDKDSDELAFIVDDGV